MGVPTGKRAPGANPETTFFSRGGGLFWAAFVRFFGLLAHAHTHTHGCVHAHTHTRTWVRAHAHRHTRTHAHALGRIRVRTKFRS